MSFWDQNPELHAEIRRSWHFIRARLRATKVPWREVRGPIATCIQVLEDLNWEPAQPDWWRELRPSRIAWGFASGATAFPLVEALTETVHEQLRARAARHFLGKGYEKGIDATVVRKRTRRAEERGDTATVGLIRTIACAAIWPRQRKFEAGLVHSPLCAKSFPQRCRWARSRGRRR